MLEYFGIKGASTTKQISEKLETAKVIRLDPSRNMPLVRRLRILGSLNSRQATPLGIMYLASKTTYGEMKKLLNALEQEELVLSVNRIVGYAKTSTKQYLITKKGLEYVAQYTTEEGL